MPWLILRRTPFSVSKYRKHFIGYGREVAAGQHLRVMDYLVAVLADRDQVGLGFLREVLVRAVMDVQFFNRAASLASVPVTLQR